MDCGPDQENILLHVEVHLHENHACRAPQDHLVGLENIKRVTRTIS
jgi:hypothetical protein